MKFRRSRHFRRQVKFYQIHYGYHDPAVVLIDGNFLKIAVEKQMDINFQFTKYSKIKCTPKITQCVLNELNELRFHFPGVFSAATKLPLVRCGHFQGVGAHECLLDLVKLPPRKEPQHPNQFYWILTQDAVLRERLVELEHVPIVYLATHNMLILMEPSHHLERKLQQVHNHIYICLQQEQDKFMPYQDEYKLIGPIKKEARQKLFEKRVAVMKKERNELQLKAKKPAKGFNPLSRMKKQTKTKTIRKRRHKMTNRPRKVKVVDVIV